MINESGNCLETDRLVLEPLCREHAGHLFPVLSDPGIYSFIPQDPPSSVLELEARYRRLETGKSPSGDELWLNWAIRLKRQGSYAGTVQATVRKDRTSLLAYELSTQFRGNGYASEACSRVIESLFTHYDVAEIVAEVDTRNAASCRLLERLAFVRVLTRTQVDFFKGEPSDEYTYKLYRDNCERLRGIDFTD